MWIHQTETTPLSKQGKCDIEKVEEVRGGSGKVGRELEGPEGSGEQDRLGGSGLPEEGGVPHGEGELAGFLGKVCSMAPGKQSSTLGSGSRAGLVACGPAPSGTVWAAAQALGSQERRVPLVSALPNSDRLAVQHHRLDPFSRQKAGGSGLTLGDAVMTGVC